MHAGWAMVCTGTRTSTSARVAPVPLTMLQKPWNFHPWRCYHTFLKWAAGYQKHRLFLHEQESWKLEKKGTEKPADHHKNIHQKAKIQNNDFVFIFIFLQNFSCPHLFPVAVQALSMFHCSGTVFRFSTPNICHSLVCPKEPLPSPIKGSCCALPPTVWLHSAQKFLHEFPCWMINFGVVK